MKKQTDHWPSGNWRTDNGNSPMQEVNSRWSVTRTGRWVSACSHLLARLSTTGGPQPVPWGWIGNNNNKMTELYELSYGLSTWEIVLEARCKFRAQWLFAPIPRWVCNTILLWECLSEKAKHNNAKPFYWKVVAGDSYFTLFFFLLTCRFQDYKWSKGKAGSGQVFDTVAFLKLVSCLRRGHSVLTWL